MSQEQADAPREQNIIEGLQDKPMGAKLWGYLKLTGPGWLQSAITLGGGSLASGLFLGVGHTPATAFLEGQLELDEKRYIKLTDPYRSMTSVEGVFGAGDCVDSVYRQAITAAAMGCKAAIDAERWLAEQGID